MAREYDGSNDGQSIPNISALGSYTIATIVHLLADGSGQTAFAFDNFPSSPRNAAVFKADNGTVSRYEAHVAGTGGVLDVGQISLNQDRHVAITRDGTTATCYLDGASEGTITVGSGTFTAENVRLGCHFFSGANQEFYNGRIAEYGVWSEALTADEIAALNAGFSPLLIRPTSLIRYIPNVRESIERMAGVTVTDIDAPTVAVHPRVIYSGRSQVGATSAAGGGGTIAPLAMAAYRRRRAN